MPGPRRQIPSIETSVANVISTYPACATSDSLPYDPRYTGCIMCKILSNREKEFEYYHVLTDIIPRVLLYVFKMALAGDDSAPTV